MSRNVIGYYLLIFCKVMNLFRSLFNGNGSPSYDETCFLCFPYVREIVIGYLQLSYVFGNEIGDFLKSELSTVMDLYRVFLNSFEKF